MTADELVGQRIRQARVRKRLTQRELAKLLGTTDVAVCYWERGQRSVRPERLAQLGTVLNRTPRWFLGEVE